MMRRLPRSLPFHYYSTTPPTQTPTLIEYSNSHHYGTVEAFEKHWTAFFASCPDTFELQRGLNNCFNYDLVPTVTVIESALNASRRLNSFATGVRVFGGLRGKVASKEQYEELKAYFKPMMEASGLCTPEDLGRVEY